MQPNLDLNPKPTSTSLERLAVAPKHAAVGVVLSLTIASALHHYNELYRRITLAPVTYVGADSTCTASVIREAIPSETAANPLEALINEIHAGIPDAVWAKMPRNFADDVDGIVYGA